MIFLFKSMTCHACTKNLVDRVVAKYPNVKIIEVKQEGDKYLAYENGVRLGDESPVVNTPSLYIADKNELYTGSTAILQKLQYEE